MKKKTLLLSAFALVFSLQASAQYASTLEDGNTWLGRFYGWGVSDYSFVVNGDSMVMNTFYKKVYGAYDMSAPPVFVALLREEVETGKVYRYDGEGGEELIYDYSLEEGESTTIVAMGMEYEVTIDSVEIITVDGEPRKKLIFDDAGRYAFWIEGVGSIYGILDPALAYSADYDPILFCFYSNNVLTWTSYPNSFQCLDVLSVENKSTHYSIEAWPNPFVDNINISLLGNFSNASIRVTSLTGKLVRQENLNTGIKQLTLEDLESGVYMLTITDARGATSTKRIVKL